MAEEQLYCSVGEHTWRRESKRGRKPLNCPEHMPTSAPKSAAECSACKGTGLTPNLTVSTSNEAICSVCGGSGEKPKPELNKAGERKLICEHDGHSWWAPVQRGRPPRFCHVHKPARIYSLAEAATIEARTGHTTDELKAAREEYFGEPSMRELYCHGGDHMWQAERKRGKPPRNCPEHAISGAIERKVELDSEKKEKAQEELQDQIRRLSARVEDAEFVDRDAMTKLQAAGGADKADDETFKIWLRANNALLGCVEALRARERKFEGL